MGRLGNQAEQLLGAVIPTPAPSPARTGPTGRRRGWRRSWTARWCCRPWCTPPGGAASDPMPALTPPSPAQAEYDGGGGAARLVPLDSYFDLPHLARAMVRGARTHRRGAC